ncbi:fungal-specific transcription factor domain-containing protein, partial [Dendryphion nanum]
LPPYPYAIHLVDQFEDYIGYEYFWYLRREFRTRLESTYKHPQSASSRDRTWLCRLLVVLALGETYNSTVAPSIEFRDDAPSQRSNRPLVSAQPPPGVAFFEQAMLLFKTPFEEATTDHVEVLNLMAFYSYSLGRRKSAYVHAGLAMRIASSLMLHNPHVAKDFSPSDIEHSRRLWWMTYQLDAMTGSEIGLNSTFDFEEIEAKLGLPTDDNLSAEDHDNFTISTIFTAHIRLCSARSGILSVASAELSGADDDQLEVMLRRPMHVIEEWRRQLHSTINFEFSNGIPATMISKPECRSLASLYLRFHQVTTGNSMDSLSQC